MKKRDKNILMKQFSPHLFWDMNVDAFDAQRDKVLIIERVMNYGFETDERLLYHLYSVNTIKRIITRLNSLNERTISYLSMVFGIKEEKFKCYGKIPSHLN
jgi:hypothetical protein